LASVSFGFVLVRVRVRFAQFVHQKFKFDVKYSSKPIP